MANCEEIIKSGLLGLAVGDALGVPVEFLGRNILKQAQVKEMMGYGSHKVPKGTWSDDTSLTIAAMDSIGELDWLAINTFINLKKFFLNENFFS